MAGRTVFTLARVPVAAVTAVLFLVVPPGCGGDGTGAAPPDFVGPPAPVAPAKQPLLDHVPAEAPKDLVVGDWPRFRGAEGASLSRETGLLTTWGKDGPPVLWKVESGDTYAAPSVVGDKLLHFHRIAGEEVLDCLDARTGKPIWRAAYPTAYVDKYGYNGGPRGSPLIEGDRVWTWGAEGKLTCFRLADGRQLWQRDLNADYEVEQAFFGVGASPVAEGDVLLLNVGGAKAGIVGVDKTTGKTRWTATDDGASYCTPVVADTAMGRLAVFLTRAGVVGLEPATGKVRFTHAFRSRIYESVNASDPLIVGDKLFVSSAYRTGGLLLRIKADGLEEVWKNDSLRTHWATPVCEGGMMIGFDGRHAEETELRGVDLATGKVMWRHPGWERGGFVKADGAYWGLTEDGRLVRAEISREGVKETASVELLKAPCWIAPVLSRGRLYVRNEKTMICLDIRRPAAGAGAKSEK